MSIKRVDDSIRPDDYQLKTLSKSRAYYFEINHFYNLYVFYSFNI